jgi:phospholipid/cholesterol/gamma-HCH transport system permease protein
MATKALENDRVARFTLEALADGKSTLVPTGHWITNEIANVDEPMRQIETQQFGNLEIDLSKIDELDTAGAWIIERTVRALNKSGQVVSIKGETSDSKVLFAAVKSAPDTAQVQAAGLHSSAISGLFEKTGKVVYSVANDFLVSMHMLGATIQGAQMKLGRGHGVSPTAIVHQMDRMGVGALPVVILMSTIIGAIIAQQGAFQLRYFGAEIFVVDLVGILVLREIGVLLTAIMVAGRSGSAITAEIGSMKMREEVDALKVIGLNPIGVLVFPRLVALVLVLPILTVVSDLAALIGAAAVASTYSGISPAAFINRLRDAIDLSTYFAGLIKAPFMAIIIGIIASVEGMKVGGSAESLGRHVTASVVKAIFVVIVVDGMFAMFYAAIDF